MRIGKFGRGLLFAAGLTAAGCGPGRVENLPDATFQGYRCRVKPFYENDASRLPILVIDAEPVQEPQSYEALRRVEGNYILEKPPEYRVGWVSFKTGPVLEPKRSIDYLVNRSKAEEIVEGCAEAATKGTKLDVSKQ